MFSTTPPIYVELRKYLIVGSFQLVACPITSRWNPLLICSLPEKRNTLEVFCVLCSPQPVVGNVLYHTTNLRRASEIFNSRKFSARRLSDRPHDGALTLPDAPAAVFFSLCAGEELIPKTSFLPRYAEPSELTASLLLDLNTLVSQKPSSSENAFRLFLVSCVPDSKRTVRTRMRATVLFVRQRDAWWCVQQKLPELDIRNNSLLNFDEREGTWSCASRFYTNDLGWRQVRLIVTVAYGLEFEEDSIQWLDVSHVHTVRDGSAGKFRMWCRLSKKAVCESFSVLIPHASKSRDVYLWI